MLISPEISKDLQAARRVNHESCVNFTLDVIRVIADALTLTAAGNMLRPLETHHKESYYHCLHVGFVSTQIGIKCGYSGDKLLHLAAGALLHDIGKLMIPREILSKQGPLSDGERFIMAKHPIDSYELIENCGEFDSFVKNIALYHHVKSDGSGYPENFKGFVLANFLEYTQLPQEIRIVTIADIYDALVSPRAYKAQFTNRHAFNELYLLAKKGQLDRKVVHVLEKMVDGSELLLRTSC